MSIIRAHLGMYSGRFLINLMKTAAVAVTLIIFLFLQSQSPDTESLAYWTFMAIFGMSVCIAVVDVWLESVFLFRWTVSLFAFLSAVIIVLDISNGFSSGWSRQTDLIPMLVVPFVVIHFIVSWNDTEMDTYTSGHYYRSNEKREGKFLRHLAFNLLPYVFGVYGAFLVSLLYGEGRAITFAMGVIAILLVFVIVDEFLRCCRWHMSFFWHNIYRRS